MCSSDLVRTGLRNFFCSDPNPRLVDLVVGIKNIGIQAQASRVFLRIKNRLHRNVQRPTYQGSATMPS